MATKEVSKDEGEQKSTMNNVSEEKIAQDTNNQISDRSAPTSKSDESNKSMILKTSDPSTESAKLVPKESGTEVKKGSTDGEGKKVKRPKPKVLSTKPHGIYTVYELERANFIAEWKKGLLESYPYLSRLAKTYWSLSPTRSVILILVNLAESLIPSASLYVRKSYLDQVQKAATSYVVQPRKLLALALADIGLEVLNHYLDGVKDNMDEVMNSRLSKHLTTQIVKAHLNLDPDQLSSRKIKSQFISAGNFVDGHPTEVIYRSLDTLRYTIMILTSSITLSRIVSKQAMPLLLLNTIKTIASIYRLAVAYSHQHRYEVTNTAWHRRTTIKDVINRDNLRRDIKVTGIEKWLIGEINNADEEIGDLITRHPWMRRQSGSVAFMRRLIINFMGSLEYAWLILRGAQQGVTLGTLHLISRSTDQIVERLYAMSSSATYITRDWKALISYYKCLELKPQIEVPENPKEYVSHPEGMKIEARNIHYRYDPEKGVDVLKGTSFVINPGEMVAVVGFNGAGKSTLAKLLTRLGEVTEGELLFNGINVKEYDPAVLRQQIAVLFQDIGQYQGFTIAENIGVGNIINLTAETVTEAAENAGASEFIEQLPYKYDSYLGFKPGWFFRHRMSDPWDDSDTESEDEEEEKKEERKRVQKNISGGQWQKIALARAFMRGNSADLLVLDEPTANLDPEAEYKLFETIKKFRKNRTTVYISHRFNTVRAADRIMVMADGKVIEMGTHDELMKLKDGKYRRLYTLQVKGFMLEDTGKVKKDIDGMVVDLGEDIIQKVISQE